MSPVCANSCVGVSPLARLRDEAAKPLAERSRKLLLEDPCGLLLQLHLLLIHLLDSLAPGCLLLLGALGHLIDPVLLDVDEGLQLLRYPHMKHQLEKPGESLRIQGGTAVVAAGQHFSNLVRDE